MTVTLKIQVVSDMNDIVTDDSEKAYSVRPFLLDYLEYADSQLFRNGGNDVYNIPHGFISHTVYLQLHIYRQIGNLLCDIPLCNGTGV